MVSYAEVAGMFLEYFLFRQGATSAVYPDPRVEPPHIRANRSKPKQRNRFCRIFCLEKARRVRYTPSGRSPVYPNEEATPYKQKRRQKEWLVNQTSHSTCKESTSNYLLFNICFCFQKVKNFSFIKAGKNISFLLIKEIFYSLLILGIGN